MQLGLLIGCENGELDAIPHEVFDVAVVVEETIVLHNIKDVVLAFAMLIYCHLLYESWISESHEVFLRVSSESGDENQTRPSFGKTAWTKEQNPEVQTVTSILEFEI